MRNQFNVSRENVSIANFLIRKGEYSAAILLAEECENKKFLNAVKRKINFK